MWLTITSVCGFCEEEGGGVGVGEKEENNNNNPVP
jgi:hypothetical protein